MGLISVSRRIKIHKTKCCHTKAKRSTGIIINLIRRISFASAKFFERLCSWNLRHGAEATLKRLWVISSWKKCGVLSKQFSSETKFSAKGREGNRPRNKFLEPFEIRMSAEMKFKFSETPIHTSWLHISKFNKTVLKCRKSEPFDVWLQARRLFGINASWRGISAGSSGGKNHRVKFTRQFNGF